MFCCVVTVSSLSIVITLYMIVILIILNQRISTNDNDRLYSYCELAPYAADASADYLLLMNSLQYPNSIGLTIDEQVSDWLNHTKELQVLICKFNC